jgi:transcription antitermination factor NusG
MWEPGSEHEGSGPGGGQDARNLRWYAIRVASNCEKHTAEALRCRDIEVFLPLYFQGATSSGRVSRVERALFPGYVFGRFDVRNRLRVLMIPGVAHIASAGRTPVPVPDEEVAAVRRIVDSRLAVEPWPFLKVGERVWIERGPLRGLEGIVVQFKGSYRLVVSIALLERSVAVEVDRESVRPVPKRTWPPTLPLAAAASRQ